MIDGLGARRIGLQLASLLWFVSSFPSSGSQPTSYGEPEVFTDFYRIAVSGSDIAKFDPLVSLNNLGRVAYIAHRAGGPSVFSGAPFETLTVASFATPEVSTDLVRWSSDGIRILKQNETADVERWSASIPMKGSFQFLRLRFSIP